MATYSSKEIYWHPAYDAAVFPSFRFVYMPSEVAVLLWCWQVCVMRSNDEERGGFLRCGSLCDSLSLRHTKVF